MYDMNIPHKEIQVVNKKIIWFWDNENHDAKNFLKNNLFVCDNNYHELWLSLIHI